MPGPAARARASSVCLSQASTLQVICALLSAHPTRRKARNAEGNKERKEQVGLYGATP